MTHPDHPAFPTENTPGLTKREYFAAMAMQGILSGSTELSKKNAYLIAEQAILTADALIYEINKRLNPESDQL